MSQDQRQRNRGDSPGGFSRWFQRKMNARTTRKLRRKPGKVMGMDLLILHTTGRRTGESRETPITWFADGDAWLVVASGGGKQHPDWFANLMAQPQQAAVEMHGTGAVPVMPHRLDGDERAQAWERIIAAQPRYENYQQKSERDYPVVRLAPR